MTIARSQQIDLELTTYYHCFTRTVRRAFLCGEDSKTGKNFDHRKTWIVERIKFLGSLFSIDIIAYAMMSNHFHLVLNVAVVKAQEWSNEEVLRRVALLCPTCGTNIENWSESQRQQFIDTWRERLCSISWFMSHLNEHIARRANKEDNCTGHFWESRFKSNALLDEGAMLACMSYVDLNPIRAGIAEGLEDSSWTSILQRIKEYLSTQDTDNTEIGKSKNGATEEDPLDLNQCPELCPLAPEGNDFVEIGEKQDGTHFLPITFSQYIKLLQWTAMVIGDETKARRIKPPQEILEKCGLDPEKWLDSIMKFGYFSFATGSSEKLKNYANRTGRTRVKGQVYNPIGYL